MKHKSKSNQANTKNRLSSARSPYLQQHADNPVDWYTWGEEAFIAARSQNKPILLSIGYSACHWCHVMAHESFADPITADVMNQHFINIKVDREERPDLDKIYQTSYQLLLQRGGGWPLTVFLTPDDHLPFFAGTYFPPEPRYGMPGFKDLLLHIAQYYHEHHLEITQQNQRLAVALKKIAEIPPGNMQTNLNETPLIVFQQAISEQFDRVNGGFGSAPKFPHTMNLELLLQSKDYDMALFTLNKMAAGGIYDQLGGGFFRYSVDARWEIPHFEKMLYDNALLLSVYAQASMLINYEYNDRVKSESANTLTQTVAIDFSDIALNSAKWIMREMQHADGGYYSTLDADSEGHEGKYYVWQREQIQKLLTADEYIVISRHFNLAQAPNFEGHWHLHIEKSLADIAIQLNQDLSAVQKTYQKALQKLLKERNRRQRPSCDDKILTAWNGLMIKGMAQAGQLLQEPQLIASAQLATDFLFKNIWVNNRLYACYKDGSAYQMAYLDDYVFLCDGLIALLAARWRTQDLQWAINLADCALNYFMDEKRGGFFFTADDHEQLIQRPKVFMDEALPAGNGIAVSILLHLGYLLGETKYLQAAEKTLRVVWPILQDSPQYHTSLLTALQDYLQPPMIVILRGEKEQLAKWQKSLLAFYHPRRFIYAIANDITDLPSALNSKMAPKKGVSAYICKGFQCENVMSDLVELQNFLRINDKDFL